MMREGIKSGLGCALFLVLLGASPPGLGAQHRPLGDPQIKELVEHYLLEEGILKGNVQVQVQGGVVSLSGTVPSAWAKARALELALKVPDVQSVESELTIARGESDGAVGEQIASQIRRYVFYTIYDDIEVAVESGVVTLMGRVTMPFKVKEIEHLASRVLGVQEVRNKIQVLPTSIGDDRLRETIASLIYRDPLFWDYSIQTNPPIHIIVENGRVTLTGVVRSLVEQRKAESIARSVFGVFSVENRLRVGS
jgi:hyperosmotically inducible protein